MFESPSDLDALDLVAAAGWRDQGAEDDKERQMTYREQYAPGLAYEESVRKAPEKRTMSSAAKRPVFRWIHIVFSIPIFGYIYSPFDRIPNYAPATRFFFVPVLVLSGLWMWKGHAVRRLLWKRPA